SARAGAAPGHGGRGGAGAERRVGLDPPPQDRQRTALRMIARHRGRDAALDRARQLTALLRTELAVAPDAATRALVEEIRNGEIEPAPVLSTSPRRRERGELSEPGEGGSEPQPMLMYHLTPTPGASPGQALSPQAGRESADALPVALGSTAPEITQSKPAIWRRRPIAAAGLALSLLAITAGGALELATGMPIAWGIGQKKVSPQPWLASAVVLPFAVDAAPGAREA